MRLEVTRDTLASRAEVWKVLTSWERQPEWMLDAEAVRVLTPQRAGEGVTIRCPTNLLGITVDDVMRVTGWEHERYLEVTHLGSIITGYGAFELNDGDDGRTCVTWWEQIEPPLGSFGEWGASTFGLPILRRIFGRSLGNLVALTEQEAAAS